jgi:hypothetical protein
MMPPQQDISKDRLLRASQRNSLRITLQVFEERLRAAREWLDGRQESGSLYERKLDLPLRNRKRAERQIQKALQVIDQLRERFDLEVELENAASILRSEMSVSWANLLDVRAQRLGRYGKVHPDLSRLLDPAIDELAEIARGLAVDLEEP